MVETLTPPPSTRPPPPNPDIEPHAVSALYPYIAVGLFCLTEMFTEKTLVFHYNEKIARLRVGCTLVGTRVGCMLAEPSGGLHAGRNPRVGCMLVGTLGWTACWKEPSGAWIACSQETPSGWLHAGEKPRVGCLLAGTLGWAACW
jgi:hypothetical protein